MSYPVNVSAAFADVPLSITFAVTSLDFDQGGVFVLVPQTALEAGEHSLSIKSTWLRSHLKNELHCFKFDEKKRKDRSYLFS